MITKLAIKNYRSILDLKVNLSELNLITGANGSGKSNLYKALRLLAESAKGGIVNSLAHEGGLNSTYWAGPERISKAMELGEVPAQGLSKSKAKRLYLGFSMEDFSYSISLGINNNSVESSAFTLDPSIKEEHIWAGQTFRPSASLVVRKNDALRARTDNGWSVLSHSCNMFDSMFDEAVNNDLAPEISLMRERILDWRFYDHFRIDKDAPSRKAQLGTRTMVLSQSGHDLAAAIQTIKESDGNEAFNHSISDAFPGAEVDIIRHSDGRFSLEFKQYGLLRPLAGSELSDGTLRYILWTAALLTPKPPRLMVINEPETSLHPELIPALARLIILASKKTQVWVVSHSKVLIEALGQTPKCNHIQLEKVLGQTKIVNQGILDIPSW